MNIKSLDISTHYLLFFMEALKINTFINFKKKKFKIETIQI